MASPHCLNHSNGRFNGGVGSSIAAQPHGSAGHDSQNYPHAGWTLNPKSPNFVPIAFYMGDILAFMASVTFLSQRL
ncbi:hypothetical protein JCM14202_2185 [Agrilactobacillus composti DSM 18527 = JCM 14202]|nr:hypothetical protein JCM14202_2185 [Agrilactobacillus composti DSM 18527 = JCM 14202]